MADLKISQLSSATTPLAGTEAVPLVQSGTTKKTTVADIAGLNLNSRTWGNVYAGGGLSTSGITDAYSYYYGTPDGSGYEFARVQGTRDLEDGFTYGSALCFYTEGKNSGATDTSTNKGRFTAAGNFRPETDNTQKLGTAANRWSEVFAGNGTINTSDAREKEVRKDGIEAAVLRAWSKVQFNQFKFKDAIEVKGDAARWHFGVLAQEVKAAFEAEGLDPFAYGILCYDKWDDLYEDVTEAVYDGGQLVSLKPTGEKRLVRKAGDRYGIRYEQALVLECAYLRSKL